MSAGTASAKSVAQRAGNSVWLERMARVGFAVSGVLHLLIAYIAVSLAWGHSKGRADQSGALALLAQHTWGKAILWLGVIGFVALGLWQLTEAVLNGGDGDAKEQAGQRGKCVAKGVVYLFLAFSTMSFARGSGTSSSKQNRGFTASLMQHTGGRVLVFVIGLVIVAVGAYHVYKGVKKKFCEDLVQHPGTVVERLAMAGYVAKGVALAIVGILFCVAGAHKSSGKATGLDGALRTLREQPFGGVLLTVVGIGLAAYGLYSFARARLARF